MKVSTTARTLFACTATLVLGLVQVGPYATQAAHAATPAPAEVSLPAPAAPPATKPVNDPPDRQPRVVTPAVPAAPLPTGTWSPLGPAPIGPPFLQSGGFYGGANSGRVLGTAVLTNGAHPGRVVIGTAGGGVWTSDDNGTTWTPRTDGLAIASLAIGDVAAAPSNSDILVAGTGEGAPCGDCFTGTGMLVSVDGGDTWTLSNPGGMFNNVRTFQVAFDPSNPNHVYVATTAGLFITTDLSTWAKPTHATYTTLVTGNVTSVVIDPTNPQFVYVGNNGTGVAKSTDGGIHWAVANSGITVTPSFDLPQEKLDIAASSPTTLYLAIGSEIAVAVYKTTDGGASWSALPAPDFTGGGYSYGSGSGDQGWYDNIIKVDPSNPNHVMAGGIAVVESNDGGTTWGNVNSQTFFGVGANKFHPDQHALTFAAGKVWIGQDGGVYLYNNPGNAATSNITNANGNLNITQFYYGFNEVSGQILAGAQDNGSARTNSATQSPWTGIIVGDGGPSAITPNETNVQFSIGNKNLRVTTDAWASVSRNITPGGSSALFTPPILIIPNTVTSSQPTTFYGGDRLYRTTNPTSTPPTWTAVATSPGFGHVSAIASSPSNPMEVYVGFDDGNIMVSSDGGATFSTLTTVPFGQAFITGISVDPTNAQAITVSVSFNDTRNGIFGAPHVAQYSSGAWTVIDGDLPTNAAVSKVVYDNGALVAATDQGVYGTGAANGGSTTWTRIGTGLPYVQTQDLFVDPTTSAVYAVTHGRGAWVLGSTAMNLSVTVTGSQTYGGTPTFTATPAAALPQGVTLDGTPTCTTVNNGIQITSTLTAGGSYTLDAAQCTGLSLGGPNAGSYVLQLVGGAFTVSAATPTITWANPASIVYGTALGASQLDATANVPGTFVYTPAAGTVLHAGANQSLSVAFTPTDTVDYNDASGSATITVTPASLTIAANNATRSLGQPNPTFSVTYSGFVNGDTAASLNGTLSVTTTATSASPAWMYPITASGLSSPNYTITYQPGTLTVTKAPTATTLTVSSIHPRLNQAVTITATVAPNPPNSGLPQPGGSVAFYVDRASSPAATLNVGPGGRASFVDDFGGGAHSIVAVYSGDNNYTGSTSSAATASVTCNHTVSGTQRSVTVSSGLTCVNNAHVGAIVVNAGASLDVENSTVTGSITANRPAGFRMCNNSVGGSLSVAGATGFVLVGDPANGCPGNTIAGSITLKGNTSGLVAIGNSYGGTLSASGNSGSGPLPGETQPIIQNNIHTS